MDGRARGKPRGSSPGAAARHSKSARVNIDFLRQNLFSPNVWFFPLQALELEQAQSGKNGGKSVFGGNLYGLWLIASDAR